jgi:fructokinase
MEHITLKLGVDLGGTKIEVIALADDGSERYRQRVPTPRHDYEGTLEAIADLICKVERKCGGHYSVGIATPGAVVPVNGLLKNSNSVWLNGKPFKRDIEKRLGRCVRIANDANCFALSEATDGAGQGAEVVFGVIVGTGSGAGIVIKGHVLHGPNALAGEWGHNPLPWPKPDDLPGLRCYCGKDACIETYLSGPGMAAHHHRMTGQTLSAQDIIAAAEQGNESAEMTLTLYEERFARSLSHVINILDPDVIILGGGMSNLKRLYTNIPKLWTRYVFSDQVKTRLLPARHGDSSGVRGAAWLW